MRRSSASPARSHSSRPKDKNLIPPRCCRLRPGPPLDLASDAGVECHCRCRCRCRCREMPLPLPLPLQLPIRQAAGLGLDSICPQYLLAQSLLVAPAPGHSPRVNAAPLIFFYPLVQTVLKELKPRTVQLKQHKKTKTLNRLA